MVRAFRERKKSRLKNVAFVLLLLILLTGAILYILFPEKIPFKPPEITEPKTKPKKVKKKKVHYDYQVTTLVNEEYYPVVHEALGEAKKSISLAMLVIKKGGEPDHPVNTLLDDLIAAHKRGVKVKVILEQPNTRDSLYRNNRKVIDYLTRAGVKAKFDDKATTTHDKLIIIDEDTIIIGNHNWTYAALKQNNEVSLLIKSSPVNPEFKRYFDSIR